MPGLVPFKVLLQDHQQCENVIVNTRAEQMPCSAASKASNASRPKSGTPREFTGCVSSLAVPACMSSRSEAAKKVVATKKQIHKADKDAYAVAQGGAFRRLQLLMLPKQYAQVLFEEQPNLCLVVHHCLLQGTFCLPSWLRNPVTRAKTLRLGQKAVMKIGTCLMDSPMFSMHLSRPFYVMLAILTLHPRLASSMPLPRQPSDILKRAAWHAQPLGWCWRRLPATAHSSEYAKVKQHLIAYEDPWDMYNMANMEQPSGGGGGLHQPGSV
eukprot:852283-Amphidinium_carterae.1